MLGCAPQRQRANRFSGFQRSHLPRRPGPWIIIVAEHGGGCNWSCTASTTAVNLAPARAQMSLLLETTPSSSSSSTSRPATRGARPGSLMIEATSRRRGNPTLPHTPRPTKSCGHGGGGGARSFPHLKLATNNNGRAQLSRGRARPLGVAWGAARQLTGLGGAPRAARPGREATAALVHSI